MRTFTPIPTFTETDAVVARAALERVVGDVEAGVLLATPRSDSRPDMADVLAGHLDTVKKWLASGVADEAVRTVGFGLFQAKRALLDTGALRIASLTRTPEDYVHQIIDGGLAAVAFETDHALVAVALNGPAWIVAREGGGVDFEVEAMSDNLEDLSCRDLIPAAPGFYRWDGRIECGSSEDDEPVWSGRLVPAGIDDLTAFGIAVAPEVAVHEDGPERALILIGDTCRVLSWDGEEGIGAGGFSRIVYEGWNTLDDVLGDTALASLALPQSPGLVVWSGRVEWNGDEPFFDGVARPAALADLQAFNALTSVIEPAPVPAP